MLNAARDKVKKMDRGREIPAGRQVHFKAMRKLASEHPSEKVGAEIRKLYSWNNESDKLINN